MQHPYSQGVSKPSPSTRGGPVFDGLAARTIGTLGGGSLRSKRALFFVALCMTLATNVGCNEECTYQVCLIEEQACIEQVANVVGCKLQRDVVVPPVRFLTAAEVLAEWKANTEPATEQQDRDRRDYLHGQALLGLMPVDYEPADAPEDRLDTVLAYYSQDTKDVVIITDTKAADPGKAYQILVHEMVHVYQDANHGLAELVDEHAPTYDRFLGLRALTEGEAVLHQTLANVELRGMHHRDMLWEKYFDNGKARALDLALKSSTPAIDAVAYFPYSYGGNFVFDAWWEDNLDQVELLYQQPPDSVRQTMAGYSAWPNGVTNDDAAFDPTAIPTLPANYTFVNGGHESVWLLNSTLQRTMLQHPADSAQPWHAALSDVSADYMSVFRWNDTDVVAVWRVRSRSPAALLKLMTSSASSWTNGDSNGQPTTHLAFSVSNTDIVLIATSTGDANAIATDIEGWQSPEETYATMPPGSYAGEYDRAVLGHGRGGETHSEGI